MIRDVVQSRFVIVANTLAAGTSPATGAIFAIRTTRAAACCRRCRRVSCEMSSVGGTYSQGCE
jgi:hypothetical protein